MSCPFGADPAICTMQVIEDLIRHAKDLDAATKRGMGLRGAPRIKFCDSEP